MSRHDYLPFGQEFAATTTAAGNTLFFTGKERDVESVHFFLPTGSIRSGLQVPAESRQERLNGNARAVGVEMEPKVRNMTRVAPRMGFNVAAYSGTDLSAVRAAYRTHWEAVEAIKVRELAAMTEECLEVVMSLEAPQAWGNAPTGSDSSRNGPSCITRHAG